jgi:hypothetical protein
MAASLACVRAVFSAERAVQQLEEAETAEEEQAAFEVLWQHAETLSFTPFDAEGEKLPMTRKRWWEQLHTIRLTVDDVEVEHTMIDPENIVVLLRE